MFWSAISDGREVFHDLSEMERRYLRNGECSLHIEVTKKPEAQFKEREFHVNVLLYSV